MTHKIEVDTVMLRTLCALAVLAAVCLVPAACSRYYQPAVPRVESYLPARQDAGGGTDRQIEFSGKESSGAPSSPLTAQPKALTLDACVGIALDKNPTVRAAQEGVKAAVEAVGEARAPYYPDLALNSGYSRWQRHAFLPAGLGGPGIQIPTLIGPTDDWSAGLRSRVTLFDSGERRAQLLAAIAGEQAAGEEAAGVRQDIAFNVHQAFYGLISAIEAESVAGKDLEVAQNHLRLTRERKAAGAVSQADVLRAQVEVANEELAMVRARNLVRVTRGALNAAMGLPVVTSFEIDAGTCEVSSPKALDIPEAMEQTVHARPSVRAALQRVALARSALDTARSAFGPKIRAEGSYGWHDSEFLPQDEEWLAGVSLELPLFSGFSRMHGLSGKKAELAREEANVRQIVLNVQQKVWTAHSNLTEAFEATRASESLVAEAHESIRTTRERYEAGAGTINDLLDSQTALARAQYSLIDARWGYFTAKSAFERAIGSLEAHSSGPGK